MPASPYNTLGKLLNIPAQGNTTGVCALCGEHSNQAHPARLPDTFTAAYKLYAGDAICEYCYPLLKNRDLCFNSWIATRAGLRTLARAEWLAVLTEPPQPPFAIYLTVGRRKQGYLALLRKVSTDRDHYWLATDWLARHCNPQLAASLAPLQEPNLLMTIGDALINALAEQGLPRYRANIFADFFCEALGGISIGYAHEKYSLYLQSVLVLEAEGIMRVHALTREDIGDGRLQRAFALCLQAVKDADL